MLEAIIDDLERKLRSKKVKVAKISDKYQIIYRNNLRLGSVFLKDQCLVLVRISGVEKEIDLNDPNIDTTKEMMRFFFR